MLEIKNSNQLYKKQEKNDVVDKIPFPFNSTETEINNLNTKETIPSILTRLKDDDPKLTSIEPKTILNIKNNFTEFSEALKTNRHVTSINLSDLQIKDEEAIQLALAADDAIISDDEVESSGF